MRENDDFGVPKGMFSNFTDLIFQIKRREEHTKNISCTVGKVHLDLVFVQM